MNNLLEYSKKAKRALPLFFTKFNDIDIYVEDKLPSDKIFYDELFKAILNNSLKVKKIFQKGGKDEVIIACETCCDKNSIFIIDGDTEHIYSENRKDLKQLYVINAYCIENYIIDDASIVEILFENMALKEKMEIKKDIELENFYKSLVRSKLITLTLHYAINRKFLITKKKFFNLGELKTGGKLCEKQIGNRINEIKNHILTELPYEEYQAELLNLEKIWTSSENILLEVVSGKDYLLPIIHDYLKNKGLGNTTKESFKLKLIRNSSLVKFSSLKDKMLYIASK